MFKFLHAYLPALKYMKMCFTADEIKQINDGAKSEVKTAIEAAEARMKAQYDEKLKESEKKVADITEKMTAMEKEFAKGKGFNIGSGNFPNRVKIGGGYVNVDTLGSKMNAMVANQKNKGEFNIIGKDCEAYYNMKLYLATLFRSIADVKNHELQTLLKTYHAKANEMLEGSAGVGAEFVPTQYETELIMLNRDSSPVINECNNFTVSSPEIVFPKEGTGITGYIVDEASPITASHVTSDKYSLKVKKFGVLTEGISKELVNDSVFDFVGYLSDLMTFKLWSKIAYEIFFGVTATWGANVGLTTAGVTNSVEVSGVPGTSFAGLLPDEFSLALQKLTSEDRAVATIKFGSLITHYLNCLKDNNGQYLYRTPQGPMQNQIWGRPWAEDVNLELSDAANTVFAVVGNFKRFDVASIVGNMSVGIDTDPYTNFASDLIRFKLTARKGLGLRRPEAFCKIKTKAS